MHGEKCCFIDLAKLDSIDAYTCGHLSSVRDKNRQIEFVVDNVLTFDVRNGFLWCKESEWCFTNDMFCFDAESGNVVFGEEFPFDEMLIDKNDEIKFFDFDEKSDRSLLEPPKKWIKERFDIYLKMRKEKYEEYCKTKLSEKFECNVCGSRFARFDILNQHKSDSTHLDETPKLAFMKRKFYVSKSPV